MTYRPFHSEQRIDFYSLNNVSVLPNNTLYSINSIRRAASEWFKKDCISSITTWEYLVEKFIQKFYLLSNDNEEREAGEDDNPDDITDIFKIEGNLFDYETPLCEAFNDFNYLLKINTDMFTFDIQGIRTYEEYELNNTITRDLEEPWSEYRVPYQLCDHLCEPYHFKNGITKWPMCSSDFDGFCNDEELPGMVQWKINAHEVAPFTHLETYGQRPYANLNTEKAYLDTNRIFDKNYDTSNAGNTIDNQWNEERRDDPTHEPSVCKIRRFEMMKYLFNADEEYIAIKESEYLNHSKDNLDAYRELLCIIDEGWVVATLDDE
ncbi:hypothetical protein Tco_0411975 [Tanacetum coccineum]